MILEGSDYTESHENELFYDSYYGKYTHAPELLAIKTFGEIPFPAPDEMTNALYEAAQGTVRVPLCTTPAGDEIFINIETSYSAWGNSGEYSVEMDLSVWAAGTPDFSMLYTQDWIWTDVEDIDENDEKWALTACYEDFIAMWDYHFSNIDWTLFE